MIKIFYFKSFICKCIFPFGEVKRIFLSHFLIFHSDERIDDYGIWTAETCLAQVIILMIDDELPVVTACWNVGVPALLVVERGLTETRDFYNNHSNRFPKPPETS